MGVGDEHCDDEKEMDIPSQNWCAFSMWYTIPMSIGSQHAVKSKLRRCKEVN